MNVSQTMETEEDLLTCLQIKLYHPQQRSKGMFSLLTLGKRVKLDADDPLRMGRDGLSCTLALVDQKVSRKQLSLQAYHTPQSQGMFFTIQNLSKKGRLIVNGTGLGYLERMDLPNKALVRFGEYEMLIVRDSGEAQGSFEVELDVLEVSPFTETCVCVSPKSPVMDTNSSGYTDGLTSHEPLETDDTMPYRM
ncbi:TRAF-interacting protein with FHA domain-containing protein A [Eucyclogobius newberryi]|uniref:TRAF-interacting protein with FHA domain-containing protein A n=1 Tax=Eucyclogobius newberryi TaxID=166745 RepID=UPI003B590D03